MGLLLALCLTALPAHGQTPLPEPQLLENGSYGPVLIQKIQQAKRRIICVFFLFKIADSPRSLPRAVASELIAAQRRGVDVTVVLDATRQTQADNRNATRLLAQGGVRVVFAPAGSTTHAKAVAIDERYVIVGSHNLTQSALTRNNELSLLIDSPTLAARMQRYLQRLSQPRR
ncbi:phospholipase D-like domain-containing protein [Geomonas silvestris]|uniref:phospholipase D-like domain-containing protein n=1 Tax=Geomonas silvestris TaxID=2740184 RepID=UPI00160F58DB|nr:phospholipase D-like domain-containing protein [Geomonas silvestris]